MKDIIPASVGKAEQKQDQEEDYNDSSFYSSFLQFQEWLIKKRDSERSYIPALETEEHEEDER